MRVEHILLNGLVVIQDYSRSVRLLFFETGNTNWPYVSPIATAFVVSYGARCFALTCDHNLHGNQWRHAVITNARFGDCVAGIKAVYKPDEPTGYAQESEILDVRVIELDEASSASFFCDNAYVLDQQTSCQSKTADVLEINGALEESSAIHYEKHELVPTFARLEFQDNCRHPYDIVLRNGKAGCDQDWPMSMSGLSGSPVFNVSQKKLCGMVTRGSRNADEANIWYVEISDILCILEGVRNGSLAAEYEKT